MNYITELEPSDGYVLKKCKVCNGLGGSIDFNGTQKICPNCYNFGYKSTTLIEYEEQIRADERNKCMNETKAFIDKHSLEIGMKKGAREFAEKIKSEIEKWWYRAELDMSADNVNCLINDALAEYEKEKNERTD